MLGKTSPAAVFVAALAAWGCADDQIQPAKATIVLSPQVLDFGTVTPGASQRLELEITNEGTAGLVVSTFQIRNDARAAFSAGQAPDRVAPGGRAVLAVTYRAPAEPGSDSATLVLETSADNAPVSSIPLLGRTGAAGCKDGQRNGDESDADCGGTECPGCTSGQACAAPTDCETGLGCVEGHCGACTGAASCRAGQVCEGGACRGCTKDAQCPDANTCTDGACVPCPGATGPIDRLNDVKHCGACNHACPFVQNAEPRCVEGHCTRGPCNAGSFDFDPAKPGCETTCLGRVCRNGSEQVTVDNDPIPEAGAAFQSIASGSSFGAAVQTSRGWTNVGVLGEPTPALPNGSSEQTAPHWRHHGGLNAVQHE